MKKEWQLKKIGDLCEVIAGQSPDGKFYNSDGKGMPFYQGKKDFGEKFIGNPTTWTTQTTRIALKGDILMSVRAPVGPVNFATDEICIGRGLAAIRSNPELHRDFLFYQLLHLQPEIAGKEGAVFASINKSEIEALPISFTPLAEQKRIVGVLDEAFGLIAKAKANAEKNLANARELFESYLQSVFANPADGWEEKRLAEVGETQTGTTPKTSDKENYGNHIPFVTPADIDFSGDGTIRCREDGLSEVGLKNGRRMKANSILMVCIGASIGKVGFVDRDVSCNQQINSLTVKSGFCPKFFYYALRTKGLFDQVMKNSAQATLPIINKGKWENLTINYPSEKEQGCIVAKLDALSGETKKLETIYKQKLADLEELKKSILHKAFNGELAEG